MTISATTQGIRPGVATSTNRPAVPFDGQVISETDTDSLKVYNGTSWIGVGGLVPIVPTSVTLGGGTATTSANGRVAYTSATTSILLNGVFSAAYTNYRIILSNTSDGATANTSIRLSVGGTPSTASEYRVNWVYGVIGTAYAENLAASTSATMHINSTKLAAQTFDVINPFLTKQTFIQGNISQSDANGTTGASTAFAHMNQAATSYDGIQWLLSSACTGTISVYGYNQ